MPKRIVITGASGNVGTALLRRLTADDSDYEIVGISRRRPPSDDVYRSAHWHELDLADPGVELELLKVFRGPRAWSIWRGVSSPPATGVIWTRSGSTAARRY
ncbi:NAD dependent epimerase/dehydratase family protein [Mycobacterium intracellulare 1956]|uniref:NAD dependent epimerase/dehydratase family protein n=1 Tax=Mycobacterium intracellulare 1956 TaxID=1299331 RepID=X8CKW8_MYCIT|nr:NAD dependent epimerase/dehydratase family protein [Mycobacterium intracellulare 1956]